MQYSFTHLLQEFIIHKQQLTQTFHVPKSKLDVPATMSPAAIMLRVPVEHCRKIKRDLCFNQIETRIFSSTQYENSVCLQGISFSCQKKSLHKVTHGTVCHRKRHGKHQFTYSGINILQTTLEHSWYNAGTSKAGLW